MRRGAEEIRAYLLGRLTDAERDAYEAEWLADGEAHAELREAENDLFDDYVAGRLTAADRQAFEARMAPEAKVRLRVARGLRTRRRSAVRQPLVMLLAACLAISTGLNAWLAMRGTPKAGESPVAPAAGPVVAPRVVTVDLPGFVERSGGGGVVRVREPREGDLVRLRMGGMEAGRYAEAEVAGRRGVIWRQKVKGGEVWLPGVLLGAGVYEVSLREGERLVGFAEIRVEE